MQALLDEDNSQTQKQLAEQLGVCQQAVFYRLRDMEENKKTGGWVAHELNDNER